MRAHLCRTLANELIFLNLKQFLNNIAYKTLAAITEGMLSNFFEIVFRLKSIPLM